MSKLISPTKAQKKAISFLLIAVLMMGALLVPMPSMASNNTSDSVKVTYKISDKESQDIEAKVPLGEDGFAKLTKDFVPNDPSMENHQFLGWKNLSAKSQEEKEWVWAKKDLVDNFTVTEDMKFKAVYESVQAEDDGKDDVNKDQPKTEEKTNIDIKNENQNPKQKKGGIKPQSNDMSVEWNGESSISTNVQEGGSKVLKVNLPAVSGLSGLKDRTLTISLKHKNTQDFSTSATDTGFSISNYTKDLSGVIKSATYDSSTKTLKYVLGESYSETSLNITLTADMNKVYKDEKADISVRLEENGIVDSGNAQANAIVKNNELNTRLITKDPTMIKSGQGEGSLEFYFSNDDILCSYVMAIDLNDIPITIGPKTQNYGQWLQEYSVKTENSPIVFYDASGNELTANTNNGLNTIVQFINSNGNNKNGTGIIKYKTTDEFQNGKFSFRASDGIGSKIDIQYRKSGRGLTMSALQVKQGDTVPNNTGYYIYSPHNILETAPIDKEMNLIGIPGIQPNSQAYKNDPDKGYLYESYMFNFYCKTTRTLTESNTAVDKFKFDIPSGMEITKIILPSEACKFGSVTIDGVSGTFNTSNNVINLPSPLTGSINMIINKLQYIERNPSAENSISDMSKIRFIGITKNIGSNPSVFVTDTDTGNKSEINLATTQDGKFPMDPSVKIDQNKFIQASDGNALGGSIQKGESFIVQGRISGNIYPYASAYYENVEDIYSSIMSAPVVYIDVPGGMNVEGVDLSGNTTGYRGENLKAVISNTFDNAGKWASSGGKIVEIKIVGSNGELANLASTMPTHVDLKMSIPDDYDEQQFGSDFTYTDDEFKVSSYSPYCTDLNVVGSEGKIKSYSLPDGSLATVKDKVVQTSSSRTKTTNIVMPSTAKVEASTRVGTNSYRIYNPSDSSSMPERPAGSKNEEFKMYVGYGRDNTVNDSTAYFILPKGSGWSPELNKKPTVSLNGITSSEVSYFYTTDDLTGKTAGDMDVSGHLTATWNLLDITTVNDSILASIKGIKVVFDKLDKGDTFNMYLPYQLPSVGGSINYGQEAIGKTIYKLGDSKAEGGKPAVKLVRSNRPMVKQANASGTGDADIPNSQVVVEFGNDSNMPKWYEAITYDDFTSGIKLDSMRIKYTPQGGGTAATTTYNALDFETPVAYTPSSQGIDTFKDGYKTTVKPSNRSIVDVKKPGVYEITYTSTADDDSQVSTATRNIKVEKTATNGLKTTQGSLEMFYDQTLSELPGSCSSWNELYRSKLEISDYEKTPSKIDANINVNDVVLKKITTVEDQNTNMGINAAAMEKVASEPGKYIFTYEYTDSHNITLEPKLVVTNKYRGNLKALVMMGLLPVNGATIENDASTTQNTNTSGEAIFSYNASSQNPASANYELKLKSLPNGYKMPTTATKSGLLNKSNNSGSSKKVETFIVDAVELKAVFDGNVANEYMKSIALFKKDGSGDQQISKVNISNEGSYTFKPTIGTVYTGGYYFVAELKDGYELASGSDFAINSGKVKVDTGTIANVDISKTLKVKLKQYDIVFKAGANGSLDNSNTKISTVSAIDHGKTWSTATSGKLPAPKADSGYYFKGWTPVLPGNSSLVTDSATYTANFASKQTLTFTAIDAPSKTYNGQPQPASTKVTMAGTLVEGHTFKDNVTASGTGTDKGQYSLTFGAITKDNFNNVASDKNLDYYYDIKYVEGNYKINKTAVTIKPADVIAMYDGNTHKPKNITASGLIPGQNAGLDEAYLEGSLKNVGTTESAISDVTQIQIKQGNSLTTDNYQITLAKGSIKINLNTVDIGVSAADTTIKYDSKKHGLSNVYGTLKGSKDTDIKVLYSTDGTNYSATEPKFENARTYNVWVKAAKENYQTTSAVKKNVTINKRNIVLTPKDVSKTYDGKKLSSSSYNLSGDNIVSGQKIGTVSFGGARINAGTNNATISNNVKITDNSGNGSYESNYNITKKTGKVTVSKRAVTVAPVSVSKKYDGNELNAKSIKIIKGSMVSGESLVNPKFSGTQTSVGRKTITVTNVDVKNGSKINYSITSGKGTLEVTKANNPVNPPVTPPTNPPAGGNGNDGQRQPGTQSNSYVEPPAPETNVNDIQSNEADQSTNEVPNSIPSMGIGDTKVPLYNNGSFDSWSIFNLVMAVAGAVLALVMGIMALNRRRYNEDIINTSWMVLCAAAGAVGILMVGITQDLKGVMTIVDMWSIFHIVLITGGIVGAAKAFVNPNMSDEDLNNF